MHATHSEATCSQPTTQLEVVSPEILAKKNTNNSLIVYNCLFVEYESSFEQKLGKRSEQRAERVRARAF
jgi:hypothetical protein